jgi:hypothetical protein
MSSGRELSGDAQDAARFAPKWAREAAPNGSARRPARADGDIWLGDAEEAARDDFRFREGDNKKLDLFRAPLEPTAIPDPRWASRGRSNRPLFMGLFAAGLAAATLAFGMIARGPGAAVGERARSVVVRPAPAAAADEAQARASAVRLVVSTPTSPFPTDEVAPLAACRTRVWICEDASVPAADHRGWVR